MKTNKPVKSAPVFNHAGGRAVRSAALTELNRAVLSCLLFEDGFYESGESIADRIKSLVEKVPAQAVYDLAIRARGEFKLRHVPLLLARELVRQPESRAMVASLLPQIIQRPDEISEFLALYWKEGKTPIAKAVKVGLAAAFEKFDEYALAKYAGNGSAIKLRDVLFLVHAKPPRGKKTLYKRLANDELKSPETWENRLSRGEDKKTVFTDLIEKRELGALALLRNLRGMTEAGVDKAHISLALNEMKVDRVLPYRFIAANKYSGGTFTKELETAMLKCIEGMDKMSGKTVLLIDVSGSMSSAVSGKSDLSRIEAACGLAILARNLCEQSEVWTFSDDVVKVSTKNRGFKLGEDIVRSQPNSSTRLRKAVEHINRVSDFDRIIVITDEQSQDGNAVVKTDKAYIINVAAYKNGVGFGKWNTVNGFSEAVFQYIQQLENQD